MKCIHFFRVYNLNYYMTLKHRLHVWEVEWKATESTEWNDKCKIIWESLLYKAQQKIETIVRNGLGTLTLLCRSDWQWHCNCCKNTELFLVNEPLQAQPVESNFVSCKICFQMVLRKTIFFPPCFFVHTSQGFLPLRSVTWTLRSSLDFSKSPC